MVGRYKIRYGFNWISIKDVHESDFIHQLCFSTHKPSVHHDG